MKVSDELLLFMKKTNGCVLIKVMLASETNCIATLLDWLVCWSQTDQCGTFISNKYMTYITYNSG